MLTLYSFGPGANSLKPLLTLYEKGLEFTSRFLNPATFEHHSEWFKKINPNGQVPVLDHAGKIITESTVICEYLEDEFPGEPSLRPADSYGRAQMRVWTKWVDEYFCWCVSTIGWHRMVGGMVRHLGDEEFEKMVEPMQRSAPTALSTVLRAKTATQIPSCDVPLGNYLFFRIIDGRRFIREALDVEFIRSLRCCSIRYYRCASANRCHSHWNKKWIHSVVIR